MRVARQSGLPVFLVLSALASGCASPVLRSNSFSTAHLTTAKESPQKAIVIGFLGGLVKHDDPAHAEVQLAKELRSQYSHDVYIATFENRRLQAARTSILEFLDTNHDGKLSDEEKRRARVVLYGHSWGASAVVALARQLEKDGIPVLLTIQVDSVAKHGQDDSLIPENVQQAVNYYQPNGWLHGQSQIRAEDPSHTKIIGNFKTAYKNIPYACSGYPWYDRVFAPEHTKIECDAALWDKIGNLIRAQIDPIEQTKG